MLSTQNLSELPRWEGWIRKSYPSHGCTSTWERYNWDAAMHPMQFINDALMVASCYRDDGYTLFPVVDTLPWSCFLDTTLSSRVHNLSCYILQDDCQWSTKEFSEEAVL